MTAQPNSTLKESPMNTTLIALFALSFSTDALADTLSTHSLIALHHLLPLG